jgi:arylsulfatase A-like enzyme
MKISPKKNSLFAGTLLLSASALLAQESIDKPNIIIILADDLGYADLGCQGSKDVITPNINSIAKNGVRCTDGYVTAPQSGPSRAALLSGTYQNRFGFESNEQAFSVGIPASQKIISERLKATGYVTGYMGKWGVGDSKIRTPIERGFDVCFWNTSGNRYFPDSPSMHDVQVYKGNKPVELNEYSTDAFGKEGVKFINKNYKTPFFLFLSFITPHVPMEALEKDLVKFSSDLPLDRRTMLAMMSNLDDNVGKVLQALRKKGIEDNTLIIFLSDNGGYAGNASFNHPFSGTKSQMLEGGIRIPYMVQWKKQLPTGKVYSMPVSSIDILPTAVAAAGMPIDPKWKIDGVNLLPYLSGQNSNEPHNALFWRFNFPMDKPNQHGWAIRKGDWKLVRNGWAQSPPALYNLADDKAEKINLINKYPEKAAEMQQEWEIWNSTIQKVR